MSEESKKRLSMSHIGKLNEKSSNWKGGISKITTKCHQCENIFSPAYGNYKRGYGKYCSRRCYATYMIRNHRNEKSSNWQGGRAYIQDKIRTSQLYKQWRTAIYERDNYTCQICKKRETKINADHIIPFAFILRKMNIQTLEESFDCEILWSLDNGRTLCEPCHRNTPTFGSRNFDYMFDIANLERD